MNRQPKERFCFNCGASMGVYADYDRMDDCDETCEWAITGPGAPQ
jgi:hypothetical protein